MSVNDINKVLKSLDDIIVVTNLQIRELEAQKISKLPKIAIECLKSSIAEIENINN